MIERPRGLGPSDRFRAWLVTGPLGRLTSVAIELAAALGRALRRRR